MEKGIGKISKGEYQGIVTDIVVGIKEYNGRVGVDIREFTQSESYTGPTKKGLRIPADKFDEFKTIINSINSDDLKVELAQKDLPESPDEDSGIDESGLM
ncbi:MAG: transcriptional coactivator p15/PC4 family protein [Nanoarchaeota archaeon]|nr:transcriptional coactivator p15/PC4 family protein [Nanoarchaeota archaeon]